MDAVGAEQSDQRHAVVEDEGGAAGPAAGRHVAPRAEHLLVGGPLHAELHPAAAPLEYGLRPREVVEAVVMVCDELQHIVSFCLWSVVSLNPLQRLAQPG